jgi:two-component system, LytTR family, response regulator
VASIRALIADDEPLARRGIRQLLARHPDVSVVGECRNGKEVLKAPDADLLFLDVQMPGLNGFDVLRNWGKRPVPVIVFVTAYEEFAVRAFEASALDYLVKPVTEPRFEAALARVRERIRLGNAAAQAARLAALLAAESAAGPPHRPAGAVSLMVSTPAGSLMLQTDEIEWIEARDYCACLHAGGRHFLIRESLRSLERRLDPRRFSRVHRGAIVRLDAIREIRSAKAGGEVLLRTGARIPVSRRRRDRLVKALRGSS